ncbi:MAG TPA: protease modulator HflC [Gemmataceae bacterium]|jgi:membrane protease subunit HflC|nr:protease modulator HflC [Gemmataceae bacterium]
MRILLLIAVLCLVVVLAGMSVFTVDRSEYVYVTLLGKHTATYDGMTNAGLHIRWPAPIQSVERIDRRLQVFDLPPTEQLTRDRGGETIDRTLTVEGYVCWRIADADGVDRFIRTVGTPERARAILSQQISSQLSAEIGNMQMDEFVNEDPGKVDAGMGGLRRRLLGQFQKRAPKPPRRFDDDGLLGRRLFGQFQKRAPAGSPAAEAADDYGIDIVDIRLRRYNYPPEVVPAIIQRITSEREKKKAEYDSEATVKVGRITADTDRQVKQIGAEAEARAKQLMSHADAEADRIRNEAFSKDVEFYVFLRKLEEYGNILGNNRTILLLSSHRQLFDLLYSPPQPHGSNGNGKSAVSLKPPAKNPKAEGP